MLPDWIAARLPDAGVMGQLRQQVPSLYWLAIATGTIAYVGVLLTAAYALLLLPLVAGRAIVATATAGPLAAAGWLGLVAGVAGLLGAVVYASVRWIGAYLQE